MDAKAGWNSKESSPDKHQHDDTCTCADKSNTYLQRGKTSTSFKRKKLEIGKGQSEVHRTYTQYFAGAMSLEQDPEEQVQPLQL